MRLHQFAEAIAIGKDRHRGAVGGQVIGHDDVGGPAEMRAEHHDDRRRLRKIIDEFIADPDLHAGSPSPTGRATHRMLR